jgi:hypothetical protein
VSILKSVGAVAAGMLAGVVLILAIEAISSRIVPLPPGTDPSNPDSLRAAMARIPLGALLMVVLAWIVGGFVSGWVAARLAPRARVGHAMIVALLSLAAGVTNMVLIPHPTWMWIAGVLALLGAPWLGGRMAAGGGNASGNPVTA